MKSWLNRTVVFWGALFAWACVAFAALAIVYLVRASLAGHSDWAQSTLAGYVLFGSIAWGVPVAVGSLLLAGLLARLFAFSNKAFVAGLIVALVVGLAGGLMSALPTDAPAWP